MLIAVVVVSFAVGVRCLLSSFVDMLVFSAYTRITTRSCKEQPTQLTAILLEPNTVVVVVVLVLHRMLWRKKGRAPNGEHNRRIADYRDSIYHDFITLRDSVGYHGSSNDQQVLLLNSSIFFLPIEARICKQKKLTSNHSYAMQIIFFGRMSTL